MSDEDDNDNGIEENEEEDSEADVMSEGSDGIPNRVVNVEGSDSALSEDSFYAKVNKVPTSLP